MVARAWDLSLRRSRRNNAPTRLGCAQSPNTKPFVAGHEDEDEDDDEEEDEKNNNDDDNNSNNDDDKKHDEIEHNHTDYRETRSPPVRSPAISHRLDVAKANPITEQHKSAHRISQQSSIEPTTRDEEDSFSSQSHSSSSSTSSSSSIFASLSPTSSSSSASSSLPSSSSPSSTFPSMATVVSAPLPSISQTKGAQVRPRTDGDDNKHNPAVSYAAQIAAMAAAAAAAAAASAAAATASTSSTCNLELTCTPRMNILDPNIGSLSVYLNAFGKTLTKSLLTSSSSALTASNCTQNLNLSSKCANVNFIKQLPTLSNKNNCSSLIDKCARKRDQNRRAALNYRRKKMDEKNRMHEEECGLVHKQVHLNGQIEYLESSIREIIETKAERVLGNDGLMIHHLCPICGTSCDSVTQMRDHLNIKHFSTLV